MTYDDFKTFIRYIKEMGLYTMFLKDCKRFINRRVDEYGEDKSNIPLKDYMLDYIRPSEEIMILINWSDSTFRNWQSVYNDYKILYQTKLYGNFKKNIKFVKKEKL